VFVDDLSSPEPTDDDVHHLRRVLRLTDGDTVCAADGRGGYRICELRGTGTLEPVGEIRIQSANPTVLSVAFAPVKGDRPEWVVQKLTELGIDRIVITETTRSVVRWNGDRLERNLAKLRKVAEGACRQSRRLWIPEVGAAGFDDLGTYALADAGGEKLAPTDTNVLIGPEGGWSDEDRQGRRLVDLSDGVLRAETAAVTAGALMAALRRL
jgi:16S rRNA (uracil1498-N3)-methyltransferase